MKYELRIGNYVYYIKAWNNEVVERFHEVDAALISEIDRARFQQIVKPIPLTEEWFIRLKVPQWFIAKIGNDNGESYYINMSFLPFGYLDIKYVHQLQNLYFCLTGEELTIKESK